MYTKRIFTPRELISWTRREIVVLTVIAAVPVLLYDVLEQKWLHLPWLPIALIGTAVAFILSFQNSAAYERTWEARKIWGGIVNSSRSFALMLNDFITNEFTDERATEVELKATRKRMVLRHVAWLTSVRHALRSHRPWEELDRDHTNREWSELIQIHEHHVSLESDITGYLSESERSLVCGTASPPTRVIALQSAELRELRSRGLIEDFRHMELQNMLNALLEGQGKSERIKNFPYPRQYATLNSVFLWIFIVLIPFGLLNEFASISKEIHAVSPQWSPYFVWLSLPFSVAVMWVFHTMERIGRVTENPFSGSVNDVPITTMSRAIEIEMRQLIGDDQEEIPDPVPPRNFSQT